MKPLATANSRPLPRPLAFTTRHTTVESVYQEPLEEQDEEENNMRTMFLDRIPFVRIAITKNHRWDQIKRKKRQNDQLSRMHRFSSDQEARNSILICDDELYRKSLLSKKLDLPENVYTSSLTSTNGFDPYQDFQANLLTQVA